MRNALLIGFLALILVGCSEQENTNTEQPFDPQQCSGGKCDIWGEDDRAETWEHDGTFEGSHVRSVGVLVEDNNLVQNGDGSVSTVGLSNLGSIYGLCEDVRFAEQPVLGYCSGFLAAEDLFVTAGHCLGDDIHATCERTSILFDYAYLDPLDSMMDPAGDFASDNAYRCEEVILSDFDSDIYYSNDVAILRLDRPVTDRPPLEFRRTGTIQPDTPVFMIGYPSGLPMKVATGGVVVDSVHTGQWHEPIIMDAERGFFFDLDMFGGNSGGPIFNANTGLVEGVAHAYSGQNFVQSEQESCFELGVCGENAVCPFYPGAYPVTEYAAIIDAESGGAPPPPVDSCQMMQTTSYGSVGELTTVIQAQARVADCSGGDEGCPVLRGQVGYSWLGEDPSTEPEFFRWIDTDRIATAFDGQGDIHGAAVLPPGEAGIFSVATRFTTDGGLSWRYCDLDDDDEFDPARLGYLVVDAEEILDQSLREEAVSEGWQATDIVWEPADGGYARLSTRDDSELRTPVLDLSSYQEVILEFFVAKWGSGGDGPVTVEFSVDGGLSWDSQELDSPIPQDSSYVYAGPFILPEVSSETVLRFTRTKSASQKRLRDVRVLGFQ